MPACKSGTQGFKDDEVPTLSHQPPSDQTSVFIGRVQPIWYPTPGQKKKVFSAKLRDIQIYRRTDNFNELVISARAESREKIGLEKLITAILIRSFEG